MQNYTKKRSDTIVDHFKKSKQAALHDIIHVLIINGSTSIEQDLLELKKKLGTNRACVLIIVKEPQYFDPCTKISRQWIQFKDLLLKYQIFDCDFFISSLFSDSDNDESIKYLNTNHVGWSFYKFNVGIIPYNDATIPDELKNNVTELFLEECHMKFSHVNFTHRMHRQLFSKFLIKEDLVRDNLIAINCLSKKHVKQGNLIKSKDASIGGFMNDDWFYNKYLLNLWRDVPLKFSRHPDIDENFDSPFLHFLYKASVNIVSETTFNYPAPLCTEKTISSLLSKRPFIMIGPCGNLQYLRDSGFKTFHTIIDESYDNIEDPNKRLEAIMQLVLLLNKKSQQELNDMVYSVKDLLIHNCSLIVGNIRNFTNIIQ